MKTIILFCVLTFGFFSISFAQEYGWKDISANIPTEADLSDVYFISDDKGWITSSSHAEIYHTTDGGETFEIQTTQYSCNAIHMIDINEGCAGGENGRVYRTTDGGENWIAIGSMGVTLTDLDFANSSQGYACGDNGAVYSVTSGGATNLNSGLGTAFSGISSPVINNVWICGGSDIYYYNGTSFSQQFAPSGAFNAIYFINNLEGWVAGTDGIIANTTNAGINWAVQTNPIDNSLFSIYFLNENDGWAAGVNGTIIHTTDGGTAWSIEGADLSTAFLRAVQFTSTTNGYIVGNNKTLFKYTEISSIGDAVEPLKFEIYPNPAENNIQIQCSEFKTESGIIEILSLDSKKILEKEVETGIENIELDLNNLKSGMYLCKITIDKKSTTKKLIIE